MPDAADTATTPSRLRRARRLLRLLRLYPPYLGAGVRVTEVSDDFTRIEVRMKLHWWNRNYVGTHFGGSLYTMCDPFYMLILLEQLGREFIVWDKSATIRFRRPGRGTVYGSFEVSSERVEEIRKEALDKGIVEPTFTVQVRDGEGQIVAEVDKLLYVRHKATTPRGEGQTRGRSDSGPPGRSVNRPVR